VAKAYITACHFFAYFLIRAFCFFYGWDICISKIAQIAKEHGGIARFIQISCLGASASSSSRMLRAKAAAEEAVLREFPEVSICCSFHLL